MPWELSFVRFFISFLQGCHSDVSSLGKIMSNKTDKNEKERLNGGGPDPHLLILPHLPPKTLSLFPVSWDLPMHNVFFKLKNKVKYR